MFGQLLAPGALFQTGLLLLGAIVLLLTLAKIESAQDRHIAGRVLVWITVLASVLPVTLDELTRGRPADSAASPLDDQLGPLGAGVSRGLQVALVIVAMMAIREAVRHGLRGASGLYWLFLLAWFATLLSAINSAWSPKLLGWLMPLIVLALFAAARAGAPLLAELRRVVLAIVFVSLTMYVLVPSMATLSATRSSGAVDARLAGVFSQPNGMGAVAAVALILTLATTVGVYRTVTAAVAIVALVLADSRTALVAVAICVPVILAAPRLSTVKGSDQVRRLSVAACSLMGGFLLVQNLVSQSTDVASLNGRTLVWDYVIQEWHTQPLLGAGPDGWTGARMLADVPLYAGQAHNQFFETLFLYGVVGLVGLGLLVGASLVGALRMWRMQSPVPLGLLVCLLVTGFSESPFKFDIAGLSAEGAIGLVAIAVLQGPRRRTSADADTCADALTDAWVEGPARAVHS